MKTTTRKKKNPRILIVTPEITYLPQGMGNMYNKLSAKAGGLADVSASLVGALFRQNADVHVALPHYRKMFQVDAFNLDSEALRMYTRHLTSNRIHLAEDRIFYYRDSVYSSYERDSFMQAVAFQREVINNIIPAVKPDLIHCNDWMTGLIPAYARRLGIPCLFTVHNIHTQKYSMAALEDRGIDVASFWKHLYFERPPYNYEESRDSNRVDMLTSGIFAAHYINTVSPTFLREIVEWRHDFVPDYINNEIAGKYYANCARGILNAPDEAERPEIDEFLIKNYDYKTFEEGKRINKLNFQRQLGLIENPNAPILFWPSRLDPVQKGCQLLADILYRTVERYRHLNLQIAIVANGPYQNVFRDIVNFHGMYENVAVCNFAEKLSRIGFAASDFVLMPSKFEPCGLPQMTSQFYGTLPIVMNTGGLHDTVEHINTEADTGNGFVFDNYDSYGLAWAIDQAVKFYQQPRAVKNRVISRVMREAKERFNHDRTAEEYIKIYEDMLHKPLINEF